MSEPRSCHNRAGIVVDLSPLHKCVYYFTCEDRLVGLVVRRPPRERKTPGLNPVCPGIFSGWSHTSDSKIDTPVATLPGAWRYRVSVHFEWVRWKVGSATSTSVWQHVKLSEQIFPRDTLACCWDVKHPTNKITCEQSMKKNISRPAERLY